MTTSAKVETALNARHLRHLFAAIEPNQATKGEVVLWPMGKPVYTVREAVAFARKIQASPEYAPIYVPHVTDCGDSSYTTTSVRFAEGIRAGIEKVSAAKVGRYYYYRADETDEVYRLTAHELAQLGAGEIDDRGADYSLWCSQTGQLVARPHKSVRSALANATPEGRAEG